MDVSPEARCKAVIGTAAYNEAGHPVGDPRDAARAVVTLSCESCQVWLVKTAECQGQGDYPALHGAKSRLARQMVDNCAAVHNLTSGALTPDNVCALVLDGDFHPQLGLDKPPGNLTRGRDK